MKYGKRLASYLFEIYPEATSIRVGLDGGYCNITSGNYLISVPCDFGDSTKSIYRKDVYVRGEEVEVLNNKKWDKAIFVCVDENNNFTTNIITYFEDQIRKPQPKEEMVRIEYKILKSKPDHGTWKSGEPRSGSQEILKSKAIELGLIEEA